LGQLPTAENMSWNPFSKTSSSLPRKSVITNKAQRDFERQIKKLDELEEIARRLLKDCRKMTEANSGLAKTERRLTQELLPTAVCQNEVDFHTQIRDWDAALEKLEKNVTDLNGNLNTTVVEPLKKLVSIFPYAREAIKKRDQALQEYQKVQDKHSKYQERERTGQNLVKLNASRQTLSTAHKDFLQQDEAIRADIPALVNTQADYFQPSLEALIKLQVNYTTEAVKTYGELSNTMNGQREELDYKSQIQQGLAQLRALSITAD